MFRNLQTCIIYNWCFETVLHTFLSLLFRSFRSSESLEYQSWKKDTQAYNPPNKQEVRESTPWDIACVDIILMHRLPFLPPLLIALLCSKMPFAIKIRHIIHPSLRKRALPRPHATHIIRLGRFLCARCAVLLCCFALGRVLAPAAVSVERGGSTAELCATTT